MSRPSLRSDQKALLFLGGIAVLGAGVRVARAVGSDAHADQPALERQMQAADSAKRADVEHRASAASTSGRRKRTTPPEGGQTISHRDARGRLDLDVATMTEIDSLPGIGPTLAKRIVVDRIVNGPFYDLRALSRVKGLSARVIAGLDTLVTFSGRTLPAQPTDTQPARRKRRSRS